MTDDSKALADITEGSKVTICRTENNMPISKSRQITGVVKSIKHNGDDIHGRSKDMAKIEISSDRLGKVCQWYKIRQLELAKEYFR